MSDSVYTLPAIVVNARRIRPDEKLLRLPGHVSFVELEPFHADLTNVAEILDQLPGLHVRRHGSLGSYSTVSIRGSSASQVSIYLDGVPLTRAGLGVTNLAELPFAGLDHIEVYRGFAPPDLAGASMGGAINLVTRPPRKSPAPGAAMAHSTVVAAAGSFGTRRWGFTQHFTPGAWNGLVVADFLQSNGDFEFPDDNGTPLNPTDDEVTARRNNWLRSVELLAKAGRPFAQGGRVALVNQWVQRRQGVAGISSFQSDRARQGSTHNLTSLQVQLPPLAGSRIRAHLYNDWRRDTFSDPESEIGLGFQDNRDVTQSLGAHVGLQLVAPWMQLVTAHVDARQESFTPWRRYPHLQLGPRQKRSSVELALEQRLLLFGGRVRLHSELRATRESDEFTGDLRTPYSRRPAPSDTRETLEPRLGARLRLLPGVHARSSYGRYHRAPGFLELFGDGGSVAGSSDLIAEEGTNRDYGIDIDHSVRGVRIRTEFAHFRNRVDHLITFLPQSQRTFVARNIGSARMEGEEWLWRLSSRTGVLRWKIEGNYTRQRTEDLGVDIVWYAGKTLPGRPERQLFSRLCLDFGRCVLGYEYEHLGQNFLDRWNRDVVARRDLHGVDASMKTHGLSLQLAIRNLTDNQALDVAGFPVPGRTMSVSTEYDF